MRELVPLTGHFPNHRIDVDDLLGTGCLDRSEEHCCRLDVVVEHCIWYRAAVEPGQKFVDEPEVALVGRLLLGHLFGNQTTALSEPVDSHHPVAADGDRSPLALGTVILFVPGVLLASRGTRAFVACPDAVRHAHHE